jgi:hypothetical protein
MKSMRTQQRGLTAIGWLILLVPVAIVFYAGIRLTPLYLNYMKVVRTLQQVAQEVGAADANAQTLHTSIEKHLDTESVDYPTVKEIKVSRDGKQWVLEANYDDQAPLFANIAILVAFDKTVKLGSAAASGE